MIPGKRNSHDIENDKSKQQLLIEMLKPSSPLLGNLTSSSSVAIQPEKKTILPKNNSRNDTFSGKFSKVEENDHHFGAFMHLLGLPEKENGLISQKRKVKANDDITSDTMFDEWNEQSQMDNFQQRTTLDINSKKSIGRTRSRTNNLNYKRNHPDLFDPFNSLGIARDFDSTSVNDSSTSSRHYQSKNKQLFSDETEKRLLWYNSRQKSTKSDY